MSFMQQNPRAAMEAIASQLRAVNEEISVIVADAQAQNRDLTPVEQADIAKLTAKFDSLEASFKAAEVNAKMGEPGPRPTIDFPGPSSPSARGTFGFNTFGGYLTAVKAAAGGNIDPRLVKGAVTTYGGESFGADGGFAVPPDFRAGIMALVQGEGTLMQFLKPIITPSSIVTLPVDESSGHSTTGIVASWTDEGAAISPTKLALKKINIPLWKAAVLTHASDELLSDSPDAGRHLVALMARKVRGLIEDALVNGDGTGKPLGILNSPALVTQAKSASGSTDIKPRDLANMTARLMPGALQRAIWLCHSSVVPELLALSNGYTPLVQPDYTKSPVGTIFGRPIVLSEFCKAVNSAAGDIVLVDPEGYGLAMKAEGLRQDATIGFAFDQGLQSFRATIRIGGTPLLSGAVARKNGTDTLSHFIALGVRS